MRDPIQAVRINIRSTPLSHPTLEPSKICQPALALALQVLGHSCSCICMGPT